MAKQKQSGLGRGLDTLFGDMGLEEENNENTVQMIDIGLIDPNKDQPRKRFDADALTQLADSIRSVGLIQPIVVSPNGRRYTIIAGERRWRAARMAELKEVPALVREVETVRRMEMSLIENIQRTDLNAIEEAQAIEALMQQCGLTQEQTAQRLGKSRSAVANLLRLLTLPEGVSQMVVSGELSEGHARALLGAQSEEDMVSLAEKVATGGLNVRQTEALVKTYQQPLTEREEKPRCAELSLVEEAARMRFGTKVTITGNERRGKLVLHYNSPEDLERIYELLKQ
ncbi:MAG: ParB/RepB/Spo0J family partition protein [Candidatus Spyradocola sp.]